MRNVFAAELAALAAADPRVVLLSGDIGNRLFDDYKAQFPARFYNCGVAEQNLMGVAAGLAAAGLRPVTYTIAPFVTTRCFEQIRDDVCGPRLPVTIVGVGGGLGYSELGLTHQSCEEVGCLRLLPHLSVLCPGDPGEVRGALRAALRQDGPVYLRLGKKGEPDVHEAGAQLVIGQAMRVRDGGEVVLLACGTLLPEAVAAAGLLGDCGVFSWPTVKPLDEAALAAAFATARLVVTIEEHSRLGGLGGAVAEWLADAGPQRARLLRLGTPDRFLHHEGKQAEAREACGLHAAGIAAAVRAALEG